MQTYYFSLFLTYDQFLSFYQGQAQQVIVRDEQGKTIAMPASHFRPYVDTLGVRGRFRLQLEKNGKFVSLEKIN